MKRVGSTLVEGMCECVCVCVCGGRRWNNAGGLCTDHVARYSTASPSRGCCWRSATPCGGGGGGGALVRDVPPFPSRRPSPPLPPPRTFASSPSNFLPFTHINALPPPPPFPPPPSRHRDPQGHSVRGGGAHGPTQGADAGAQGGEGERGGGEGGCGGARRVDRHMTFLSAWRLPLWP